MYLKEKKIGDLFGIKVKESSQSNTLSNYLPPLVAEFSQFIEFSQWYNPVPQVSDSFWIEKPDNLMMNHHSQLDMLNSSHSILNLEMRVALSVS